VGSRKDLYGKRLPEELPAYAIKRAAQIVRLSPSTLRLWTIGPDARLIEPASFEPPLLSFSNLIEAFVLASMRRVHGISMQRVRKALRFVGKELRYERPLLHARFQTDGVSLFTEHAGHLLNVSKAGQAALRHVLDASLRRIDWEKNFAARLYPWVRAEVSPDQPRTIVVDPRRGFGQPVIAGTGIEARIVAQRHRAGESITHLAKDYGVDFDHIEDAIRCETREAA
jgi:uncharacterized protein (DUF433 family)